LRALVQRVASASVTVGETEVSRIGPGMLVLLGVGRGDGAEQAERLADKLLKLRIFEDADGRTNEPLGEREILCVSQFTLMGDVSRGNRPGFGAAAEPALAEELYERVCERLGAARGRFGARMAVELVNDGPFTLLVEA
jgi:D-tyrosyl-tRNA(Tyr) deacylase